MADYARLFLVRHGETRLNREGRAMGRTPAPLTPRGRRQAEALAAALAREPLQAVYSSPLRRALETARLLARPHNLPVTPLPDLAELDTGALEGLTGEEMHRRYPSFMRAWREDPATATVPGGESLAQVQERAWRALLEVARRHPGGTVAVVSHHLALLAALCRALGMPLASFRRLRLDLGAYALLRLHPSLPPLVERLNHRCHLERAGLLC